MPVETERRERAWLLTLRGNQVWLIFLSVLLHAGEFIDLWPSPVDRSVPPHLTVK